ncbi:MAG: hypothetical protein M0R46_06185 [Candidatus Muirbacterium halophilum]|nr:hypothetical protein [Candidatus Muirbacterium halophilum]
MTNVDIPNVIGYNAFHNYHRIININSKLIEEQLLFTFGSKEQYNVYKQRNREYKFNQIFNE